ncbi:MAG TPA: Ku protein [Terracidiphilus sp.]|nr:Ku protein [Terracidiphilus sp.]
MASRPYWSGQFKVSLVSFGIQLFPATVSQSGGVTFHQIDRATGERIRHLNVVGGNQPVENSDIVKGYEYSKGKYLMVEPDEIANLRIATRNVIDVQQFIALEELPPALFEKPYFVVPEPKESPEAFVVFRDSMKQTGRAAIGEIAFGGREHLVAIAVPPGDSSAGLMAYTLRYAQELRDSSEYFSETPGERSLHIDKKQLAMATQLIEAYSQPLNLDAFKDDYEAALRELIEAKQKNVPLPLEEEGAKPTKVINLMDALRQSVSKAKKPVASDRPRERHAAKAANATRKGPVLVGASKRKHRAA